MRAFHYTEVEPTAMPGIEGVTLRWALGDNVGAPHFALRVIDVQPGAATEHHAHDWKHEVYVLAGRGAVTGPDGRETAISTGTCVYVAPNEMHRFANTGAEVLRFICVIPNPA